MGALHGGAFGSCTGKGGLIGFGPFLHSGHYLDLLGLPSQEPEVLYLVDAHRSSLRFASSHPETAGLALRRPHLVTILLIMLRGLKLLQSASWSKSRNFVEWREKGGLTELVLAIGDGRGLVYVLGEETTFKDLLSKDVFKYTQFKFPKDFNP